jgi:hypothetical protein
LTDRAAPAGIYRTSTARRRGAGARCPPKATA